MNEWRYIEMASLQKRSRRLWMVLCLVVGLMILPAITAPLVGDELASWIPGVDVVLAEDSAGGGG
jgi:hypothetical protein